MAKMPLSGVTPGVRRIALTLVFLLGSGLLLTSDAATLNISNRYSPKNSRRPVRPETRFIVLHTTEGGERGSLRKIYNLGEAHYFVNTKGKVYRVIEKSRIATHAGRSMWDGLKVIDNYSIGIEVVGYHNKDITEAQYDSLRELLRQLKSLYDISDENVLTHSMVAYGRPNRFHRYYHRGRKRCGMIFSRQDVREKLGLTARPLEDPDVEAGRLRVADPELHAYLFAPIVKEETAVAADTVDLQVPEETNLITPGWTAWSIARDQYSSQSTVYVFPDGTELRGDQVDDWSQIPPGTRVVFEEVREPKGFEGFLEVKEGDSAASVAGEAFDESSTIYFLPNGMVRTGKELASNTPGRSVLGSLPGGTRVLVGYVYGGHITPNRPPSRVAGTKWNYPSTFYRFPDGSIVSGDEVDEETVPNNSLIFFQG